MTILDFNFDSGEKALFNFVGVTGSDEQVIVHIHEWTVIDDEKVYIVSAPANILRETVAQPDHFEGIAVPEGWWMFLVEPDELEPVNNRVLRVCKG